MSDDLPDPEPPPHRPFEVSATDPRPWDRQPRESAKAYNAFCSYRDKPVSSRTYAQVAREFGVSDPAIASWGKKYRWQERCLAWLEYVDRHAQAAFIASIREMSERQAQLGRGLQARAGQKLAVLDANTLTPADVVRFAEAGVKIERLARGVSTDNSAVHSVRGGSEDTGGLIGHERDTILDALAGDPDAVAAAIVLAERLEAHTIDVREGVGFEVHPDQAPDPHREGDGAGGDDEEGD